jgi:hypothetical protein
MLGYKVPFDYKVLVTMIMIHTRLPALRNLNSKVQFLV